MIKHIISLLIIVLFTFSACSYKKTKTFYTNNRLTAFTVGDYEITQISTKLCKKLNIPLYKKNHIFNYPSKLDAITLIDIDGALALILNIAIFEKQQATLKQEAIKTIEKIALIIKEYPHIIIQVTGHATQQEEPHNHQNLSDNRAISIAEIFYEYDIKNDIYAKGCADKKSLFPIVANSARVSIAPIEIYLYGNKEKMIDHCK